MKSEWIEWHGGECPVSRGTLVDVEYRDGDKDLKIPARCVTKTQWRSGGFDDDVVAYRIRETPEQHLDRLEREIKKWRVACELAGVNINQEPEQWGPEGGRYIINKYGDIGPDISDADSRNFGMERDTYLSAAKARNAMRIHNRALAYVHEMAPDWNLDDENNKPYAVYHDGISWKVTEDCMPDIGTVLGPERVMQKLADDLNANKVKL